MIAYCRAGKAAALRWLRSRRACGDGVRGDPKSVKALKTKLGDAPIDIVINNAGISGPRGQVGVTPFDDFHVFAVNSLRR